MSNVVTYTIIANSQWNGESIFTLDCGQFIRSPWFSDLVPWSNHHGQIMTQSKIEDPNQYLAIFISLSSRSVHKRFVKWIKLSLQTWHIYMEVYQINSLDHWCMDRICTNSRVMHDCYPDSWYNLLARFSNRRLNIIFLEKLSNSWLKVLLLHCVLTLSVCMAPKWLTQTLSWLAPHWIDNIPKANHVEQSSLSNNWMFFTLTMGCCVSLSLLEAVIKK